MIKIKRERGEWDFVHRGGSVGVGFCIIGSLFFQESLVVRMTCDVCMGIFPEMVLSGILRYFHLVDTSHRFLWFFLYVSYQPHLPYSLFAPQHLAHDTSPANTSLTTLRSSNPRAPPPSHAPPNRP